MAVTRPKQAVGFSRRKLPPGVELPPSPRSSEFELVVHRADGAPVHRSFGDHEYVARHRRLWERYRQVDATGGDWGLCFEVFDVASGRMVAARGGAWGG